MTLYFEELKYNSWLAKFGYIGTLKAKGFTNEEIRIFQNNSSILLPLIRSIMPSVIAHDIIGAQPMTGPVGQIYTLRTRYKN